MNSASVFSVCLPISAMRRNFSHFIIVLDSWIMSAVRSFGEKGYCGCREFGGFSANSDLASLETFIALLALF
jgi:hypothetical protein